MGGALRGGGVTCRQRSPHRLGRAELLLGKLAQPALVPLAMASSPFQPGAHVDAGNDELGLASLGRSSWRMGARDLAIAIGAADPTQKHAEQLIGIDGLGDVVVLAPCGANFA